MPLFIFGHLLASEGLKTLVGPFLVLSSMPDLTDQQTLSGHQGPISGVSFSGNGELLASASNDGTVRIWNVAEGVEIQSLPHGGPVAGVVFVPTGERVIAWGEDGTIRLWDLNSGNEIASDSQFVNPLHAALFSPDGRFLASTSGEWHDPIGNDISVWDVSNGRLLLRGFLEEVRTIETIAFSHDSNLLAAAGEVDVDSMIGIWDVATGQELQRYPSRLSIHLLEFSPDGSILAAGNINGGLNLYDVAAGEPITTITPGYPALLGFAFTLDGNSLVTPRNERDLMFIDPRTGNEFRTAQLEGEFSTFEVLDLSSNGDLLAILTRNPAQHHIDVRLWDMDSREVTHVFSLDHQLEGFAYSADNQVMVIAQGGRVSMWNTRTGKLTWASDELSQIASVSLSRDAKILALADPQVGVKVYDTASQQTVSMLLSHIGSTTGAAFSPTENKLISWGSEGRIRVWRTDK